jgi:hypothetical protein
MFAASHAQQTTPGAGTATFMVLEGLLLVVALTITWKSYSQDAA